jgi:hypothetical protein
MFIAGADINELADLTSSSMAEHASQFGQAVFPLCQDRCRV